MMMMMLLEEGFGYVRRWEIGLIIDVEGEGEGDLDSGIERE